MNFVAMLAILSVPFFAIWILALRGAARAGGNGVILSMDPDAQPIEPQFSGAEKLVDRGVDLTAADVALYNAHRFATGSDHSIGDLSISRGARTVARRRAALSTSSPHHNRARAQSLFN